MITVAITLDLGIEMMNNRLCCQNEADASEFAKAGLRKQ